jgi:hypothetical protein
VAVAVAVALEVGPSAWGLRLIVRSGTELRYCKRELLPGPSIRCFGFLHSLCSREYSYIYIRTAKSSPVISYFVSKLVDNLSSAQNWRNHLSRNID